MKNFLQVGAFFWILILLFMFLPFILWLLWEPIMVENFNAPNLTFMEVVGLWIISNILFKNYGYGVKKNA